MKTTNVNGQNGVATSALKNAVVKAVKMINKAENTKVTNVKISDDMRLSFDGVRFIRNNKDNFIFNGKIEQKGRNGRYNSVLVEIHYKNLDNDGLCLNDMVNGVLDAILVKIDNWINNYYKSKSSSKWVAGLEMYQNIRNEFFGSKLVVDNTDNLNSPDASDETDTFIDLNHASEQCDGNMMACVDKYGRKFINAVLIEYDEVVDNALSDYDFDDTIKYCVKGALDNMVYDPDKKRLVGCSTVPYVANWDDADEFCEYFENAYGFDWRSCVDFYEKYYNYIWSFADECEKQMKGALRHFDKKSVFDKMPYNIEYNEGIISVSIDMDDFVNYIKKNIVFNTDMSQLFKYEDLGLRLYNYPDNKDINQFYKDLISMNPIITDVKLYNDGLYFWYEEKDYITIRQYYELYKNDEEDDIIEDDYTIREYYKFHKGDYCDWTDEPINCYVDDYMSLGAAEVFKNLVKKLEDCSFYIKEDDDGNLYVSGSEDFCKTYFNDDAPMVLVYGTMMNKMNEEIIKIETDNNN